MTMLPNIEEAMEDARNGKLSPYWQNNLKRECLHGKLSAEERLALSELNCILSETPQWSSEEEPVSYTHLDVYKRQDLYRNERPDGVFFFCKQKENSL